MNPISKLKVQHIRSHESFTLSLSPTITVITGRNGAGKTSLLEALYITLQGSSFRGSDQDVLLHDTNWWRIDILYQDHERRSVKYESLKTSRKKQFLIEEKPVYRLTSRYRYPVVLFEPDDLRLLHGSPTRRRQFIDRFISQLDPKYITALHSYERALKQRNTLLKREYVDTDQLFVWDMALATHGAYIIEQRLQLISTLQAKLNTAYNHIAQSADTITITYSYKGSDNIKQSLLSELHTHQQKDIYLGTTSVGPHRHDILFFYNSSPALSVASRGEVRSIVLALKFLEVDIIEEITGKKPLILLDDVFSELDEARQHRLLLGSHQTVITTTHFTDDDPSYMMISLS